MKLAHIRNLLASLCLLGSMTAHAVPTLQLGIGGGTYDSADQTIVTTSDQFTLYAYARATGAKAIDVNRTHYLAIAVTPQIGPAPVPFGSFVFNGTTYDIDDMTYGNPPFETYLAADPGDLASHGIYSTFFLQVAFNFNPAQRTAQINTQTTPGSTPTNVVGGALYYQSFTLDTTNLFSGYNLHFDLYNSKVLQGGDIDVDAFAPFSHDAGTQLTHITEVPEPSAFALCGLALAAVGLRRQRR